jgi:hypothetical protein
MQMAEKKIVEKIGKETAEETKTWTWEQVVPELEKREKILAWRVEQDRLFRANSLWTPASTYLAERFFLPLSGGLFLETFEYGIGLPAFHEEFEARYRQLSDERIQELWIQYIGRMREHYLNWPWPNFVFFHTDKLLWDVPDFPPPAAVSDLEQAIHTQKIWQKRTDLSWKEQMPSREMILELLQRESKAEEKIDAYFDACRKQEIQKAPLMRAMVVDGDEGAIQDFFDERWPDALKALLPKPFQARLRTVELQRRTDPDKEWMKKEKQQIAGQYESVERSIYLYSEHVRSTEYLPLLFHELGHALHLDSEKYVGQEELELLFLAAARKRENTFSKYVRDTYKYDGPESGLMEDIAETFSFFFCDPSFLRAADPDRYRAMERAMNHCFPEVDVEKVREKVCNLNLSYRNRLRVNPTLFDKALGEAARDGRAWSFISERFPTQWLLPLDRVLKRGEPSERIVRKCQGGEKIIETMDQKGRLQRVEAVDTGGQVSVYFGDPVYDAQDRLVQFTDKSLVGKLTYAKDESLPTEIRIQPADGWPGFVITYQHTDGLIEESLKDEMNPSREIRSNYRIHEGRIDEIECLINGFPVLCRKYHYGNDGRLAEKIYYTLYGEVVDQSIFSYE